MQDKLKQEKIRGFMADKLMAIAVKEVLRETFMKESGTQDIHTLASERIAINLLEDGFKELKKSSNKVEQEVKESKNIGL